MKNITIKILLAVLTIITLCSFVNRPDKIQRRWGIVNVNDKGKVVFTPLEEWKDYVPVNDTLFQIRIN